MLCPVVFPETGNRGREVRGLHRRVVRQSGEGFSTRVSAGDREGEMPPDDDDAPRAAVMALRRSGACVVGSPRGDHAHDRTLIILLDGSSVAGRAEARARGVARR